METDIRDHLGSVVIAHDPVWQSDTLSLEIVRALSADADGILALNVKSDGLAGLMGEPRPQEFFFDMSAPETLKYSKSGLQVALRLSDFEPFVSPSGVFCDWIWLDSFQHDWFISSSVQDLTGHGEVVVVSPELHGRDHLAVWSWLADNWAANPNLNICTDFPREFLRFISK